MALHFFLMNLLIPMKSIFSVLAILLIIGSMACQNAQPDYPPQLLRVSYESTLEDQAKDCFVYLPRDYEVDQEKKWPVLMFLHGDGERGNGREELKYVMIHGPLYEAWVQKRDLPFIIISPQLPMFGRDTMGIDYLVGRDPANIPRRLETGTPDREAYFDTADSMRGSIPALDFDMENLVEPQGWDLCEIDLITILDKVQAEYRADTDRTYLTGLSYGGFGTWYLASKHPERFAAISPVVGWGHPGLVEPIATHQVPVWEFAGGRDQVVQSQYFYAGLNKLEALGHQDIRFTIHEDMGHDTWKRVYAGEDLYNWLLTKKR